MRKMWFMPQCPTYTLSLNENESPRGRISLIQAISAGQLKPSDTLLSHLDHCLQCRRCECICPSQVQYGTIIQRARNELASLKPATSVLGQLGLWLIEKPQRRSLLHWLLRTYQQSGMQWLLRKTALLKLLRLNVLEAHLPEIQKSINVDSKKTVSQKKRIALFTGCMQPLFDSQAIASAHKLLTQLGYDVVIPEHQVCCGALHTTQGQAEKTLQLLKQNAEAFNQADCEKVLYLSTGCGAFIHEQKEYPDSFSPFQEITDFLNQDASFANLKFKPLQSKVAVHLPCSQKNVLKQNNVAVQLLQHIPQITLLDLEQSGCCGAGGTTMISHPEIADKVRQPLLESIEQNDCAMVVTTNPGCQLHLRHGFNSQQSEVNVIHPVTLLAQQLEECDLSVNEEVLNETRRGSTVKAYPK